MPTWPSTLPEYPLQDGFDEKPPMTAVRSQTDTGPGKQRSRFTAGVRPFSMRFHMTAEQLATFDDFYTVDLVNGVVRFDWVHPRTRVARKFRFNATQPPTYAPAGGTDFIVSFTIEMLP